MNPRLPRHSRIDRGNHPLRAIIGLTIALLVAGQAALAQSTGGSSNERPRGKTTKVERVGEAGRVAVKLDGKECELALAGVEWPEDEADAEAAQEFLERLLDGEAVAVEVLREEPAASQPAEEDKIQRAYFRRMPDGLFVNVELVRLGFAQVRARPSFDQLAAFREAEKRARDRGVGVWAGGDKTTTPKAGQRRPQGREKPADKEKEEPAAQQPKGGDTIVYITPSGKRYHKQNCQHARNGRSVTIREARDKGLTPCGVCKPPEK